MINSADFSGKLAVDATDLNVLRASARQNSPESVKAAAKQFEALFMNMVMKSMREATPQEDLFGSQQTKMYTSMLDQQISQTLANRGVGLADVLVRQLSNNRAPDSPLPGKEDGSAVDANADAPAFKQISPLRQAQITAFLEQMQLHNEEAGRSANLPSHILSSQPAATVPAVAEFKSKARLAHVRAFEDRLMRHAEEASRATGIPAKFMLGQAALETGWGKREIRGADGTASHNLFGIKATAGWKGKVVEAATTEYVNGVAQTKIEKFRAYDSYAESFRDYARLLTKNPRYEKVIANAQDASSFAHGLQRAGYATDPHYAAKLTRIIQQTLSA